MRRARGPRGARGPSPRRSAAASIARPACAHRRTAAVRGLFSHDLRRWRDASPPASLRCCCALVGAGPVVRRCLWCARLRVSMLGSEKKRGLQTGRQSRFGLVRRCIISWRGAPPGLAVLGQRGSFFHARTADGAATPQALPPRLCGSMATTSCFRLGKFLCVFPAVLAGALLVEGREKTPDAR